MSDLLAASFDAPSSPAIDLAPSEPRSPADPPFAWGVAWYPGDERAAALVKGPTSLGEAGGLGLLRDWDRFRSSQFIFHLRGAAPTLEPRDTQPFVKAYAGRDWAFAHQGDLSGDWRTLLALPEHAVFEPTGVTDSEHAFCWLLERARATRARTLSALGWDSLYELLARLSELGQLNLLVCDGQAVIAYHGTETASPLFWTRRVPPHPATRLESQPFALELNSPFDVSRTQCLVSTQPLGGARWQPFEPGQMLVLRRGHAVWNSHPSTLDELIYARREVASQQARNEQVPDMVAPPQVSIGTVQPQGAQPVEAAPMAESRRVLTILHETVYSYNQPVERSTHRFRLEPVHDHRQSLIDFRLEVFPSGPSRSYEDVFGNRVVFFDAVEPFSELRVSSFARVSVEPTTAQDLLSPQRRDQIPLVWMPWQRQMMMPYLMPPELPETQLRELSEYAMSFVERNDFDLLATVLDINRTLYRDYRYVAGSTHIETTPFEVYTNRHGVCQDFANLFICLARLLSVPARYRVGYIHTGGSYENKIQSDASHAWVEIYLPWTGWRGFDPTNGCLAGSDHVRVACGRLYWDATPTSGTIYQGGGGELLSVRVEVRQEDGGELN